MYEKIVSVVAVIKTKPEDRDFVMNEIFKVIPLTRAENGCINYDFHQDINDENIFIFYENWESRAALQAHANSDHMKNYSKLTENSIIEKKIYLLNKLDK